MQENTSTESEKATQCPWLSQIKPWNGLGIYVDHLANHYALLAMNKATIDHARYRAKELRSAFPTLSTLIAQRLKELRNEKT